MGQIATLHGVHNIGLRSLARSFPGFPEKSSAQRLPLSPREARRFDLAAGDLLSLEAFAAGQVYVAAFDARGAGTLAALGLTATGPLPFEDFDHAPLTGWIAAQGGKADAVPCAALESPDDLLVLKAQTACTVWLIHALTGAKLVSLETRQPVWVSHKPAQMSRLHLPEPLGEIREEFTVKAGTAEAYELRKGEVVQILDVEGQQCSDFMAFNVRALDAGQERMIDSTATRSMVHRAFPGPGLFDKFYDRDMQPLLNLVQDTCGRHDTFGLACTARSYEERGFPGHVNCSDNMSGALARFGVAERRAWPAINFFWNTWVDQSSHHIMTEESHSRPGDYVALRAMEELVCTSTACPDDLDPINGWNPTDIHVRIYKPEAPIRRAVAYREKEDAPMSISEESAFHEKTSQLTQNFAPARDLWLPVSYPATGTLGEYWACRNAVTLQDMSGLRKFDVVGPDAERLLQKALTKDVAKLAVWRGTYALICDETGAVVDDGTLFRLGNELFRWCCGTEESGRILETLAEEEGLQVRINALRGALPNLALQGPKSRDLLRKITFTQPHVPAVDDVKWFGVTVARLNDRNGVPFMLSRSGYTGELGYELFCSKSDAPALWDALMEAGAEFGIKPMGGAALEIIRIEAGLAASGAEFAPGIDAYEAGLGFAVDLRKSDFVGRAALERNAKDPRRLLRGLLLDVDEIPAHGAPVFAGERQVGVVTSATRSPSLERGIAMARLAVEHAAIETRLEIGQLDGHMKRLAATVADVPFVDPQRKRARA